MDKNQQIEEIETAIMNYADKYDWGIIAFECENLAIVLHNLGYRKIDDKCAVITKAELKKYKEQAVKEFAEKLWNKIKDNGIDYKIGLRALGEEIDELLKEYEK